MFTPEILNLLVGTILGGVFKLIAQSQANHQRLFENAIKANQAADASADAAAKRTAGSGGEWTRRLIVIAVLFTVFLAPFILAAWLPATPIFYAWQESTGGFWFLKSATDKLHVVRVDGFTLLPIHTQLAACIAGFYFGAGIAKAK